MNLKPMLAATVESPDDLDQIAYPVYISPKIDGVRGLTDGSGKPYTRKGEDFLNPDFNRALVTLGFKFKDFEIGIGNPNGKPFFNQTSGWLRSEDAGVLVPADGAVTLYIFDTLTPGMTFDERWVKNKSPNEGTYQAKIATGYLKVVVKWVPQVLCHTKEEVLKWEQKFYDQKWEGIMIRGALAKAKYKHGRASMLSQELMKYKRFKDDEGKIVGFEEQQTNTNEKTTDAFGHSKRSSAKAGKVPNGHAGKLLVESEAFPGVIIKIGTGKGLTKALRKDMWEHPEKYVGRTITFWHQIGSDYSKPRFPSFKGFRDDGI